MVQKEGSHETESPRTARRGRPRRYDPAAALDAILEVFWRAGYSAASLDDICEAAGMNRPSVYAAFGDKRALYLKAIARYREISREQIGAVFASPAPLKDALRGVYARALDLYYSGHDTPLGCFMVGAVISDAVDDADIRAALAEGLQQFDAAFERRIAAAQAAGEIDAARDAAQLGKLASSALYYLAARSRAGEARASLEDFADSVVDLICGA